MTGRAKAAVPTTPWVGLSTLPITLLVQSAASAAIIAPSIAAPALLQALGASTVFVGVYIATVYFAAMGSSLVGSALVRRWGPIRTSQAALLTGAAGLFLITVPQPAIAFVGAILLGCGYGPITPASSEMLARTTPTTRLALVFSIKQTGVPLGGVLAGLIVPLVLALHDARWSMAVMAAVSVVSIVLAELLRNALDAHRDPVAPMPAWSRMIAPLRFVIGHPVLRPLALCSFVFSAVQVCLSSYLVTFLHGDLGWTIVAAGAASSIAQTAAVGGRVAWGHLADRWRGGPRWTLFGLASGMTIVSLAMPWLTGDTAHGWVIALLALYGCTAIGWNGVYLGTVARVVPHDQAAMATGGSLFFTYFGVVLGLPSFGLASNGLGHVGPAFALLALPLAWTMVTLVRSRWRVAR